MSKRLYYTDAYTTTFSARVIERTTYEEHPALILNESAFYPTSGGQPYDTGTLNDIKVIDVQVRPEDNAVLHIVDETVAGDAVKGHILWERRFDHMQHHTGQHILTGAFIEIAGANTVGFHLGTDSVTLDLDKPNISTKTVAKVEQLANSIITKNVPVHIWFPSDEERAALNLRKTPDVTGALRVVSIGDFDQTACGGTHVAHTGEIGLIKVLRTEHYKGMTRVEFLCGGRAIKDYQEKSQILNELAGSLTTGHRELGTSLQKLQRENKQLRSELKTIRQQMIQYEAQDLLAANAPEDGLRIMSGVWQDRDGGELRILASHLIEAEKTVVLLGVASEKSQVILACSNDLESLNMVPYLQDVVATAAGDPAARRGGGRPTFAQGGGFSTNVQQIEAAFAQTATQIKAAFNANQT